MSIKSNPNLSLEFSKLFGGIEGGNSAGGFHYIEINLGEYSSPLSGVFKNNLIVDYIKNNFIPVNNAVPEVFDGVDVNGLSHERMLYFDIETWKLGDTMIFLIGTGHFKNNNYVIGSYFAKAPLQEVAILQEFCDILKNYPFICTFNGKSFDNLRILKRAKEKKELRKEIFIKGVNILSINYLENRLRQNERHIDLLEILRRLHYNGLFEFDEVTDLSVKSIEPSVFDFYRENDVDGKEIGKIYQKFVFEPDKKALENMRRVVQHNLQDVVTLPALFLKLLKGESLEKKIWDKDDIF